MQWDASNLIKNAGTKAGITSLTASNNAIYGTGYVFGGGEAGIPTGTFEGVFSANPSDGAINWVNSCHGDTYSAFAMGGVAYWLATLTIAAPSMASRKRTRGRGTRHGVHRERDAGEQDRDRRQLLQLRRNSSTELVELVPELAAGTISGATQAAWSISGNNDYIVLAASSEGQ